MAKIWNLKLAQRSLGSGLGLSPEGAETAALILAAVETMLAALLWLGRGRAELWAAIGLFSSFLIYFCVHFVHGDFICGCFPGLSNKQGLGAAVFAFDLAAVLTLLWSLQGSRGRAASSLPPAREYAAPCFSRFEEDEE